MFLLEKAMEPHSSTLAWKIPWAEEPGRLQSMELRRVGHDWATSLSLFTFMHWRRKWQPTPVLLPGEPQGRGSLMGCRLWGAQSRTRLKRLSSSSSSIMFLLTRIIWVYCSIYWGRFFKNSLYSLNCLCILCVCFDSFLYLKCLLG